MLGLKILEKIKENLRGYIAKEAEAGTKQNDQDKTECITDLNPSMHVYKCMYTHMYKLFMKDN